jgi:hypothetical protein
MAEVVDATKRFTESLICGENVCQLVADVRALANDRFAPNAEAQSK